MNTDSPLNSLSAYSDPIFTEVGNRVSEVASELGQSEFYTVGGRRIRGDRPVDAGIYIEKKAGKTAKRMIR